MAGWVRVHHLLVHVGTAAILQGRGPEPGPLLFLWTPRPHPSMAASASGRPELSSGSLDEVLETPGVGELVLLPDASGDCPPAGGTWPSESLTSGLRFYFLLR